MIAQFSEVFSALLARVAAVTETWTPIGGGCCAAGHARVGGGVLAGCEAAAGTSGDAGVGAGAVWVVGPGPGPLNDN